MRKLQHNNTKIHLTIKHKLKSTEYLDGRPHINTAQISGSYNDNKGKCT